MQFMFAPHVEVSPESQQMDTSEVFCVQMHEMLAPACELALHIHATLLFEVTL